MTASVQYWRLPDEEGDMIAYLRSVEPTVAIPLRRVTSPDELVWRPIDVALRESDGSFLITPARFAPLMQIHHGENGYGASVTKTPALYYARGQLVSPQRLSSTALSAEWEDKPTDFVRWGRNVMQWVRRVAPGWYRYKSQRITPKAEAARQAGMEMVM